jgi:hypothetical protein
MPLCQGWRRRGERSRDWLGGVRLRFGIVILVCMCDEGRWFGHMFWRWGWVLGLRGKKRKIVDGRYAFEPTLGE